MILLSGTVTLFTTLIQLSWDYSEQFHSIEQRQLEIKKVHAPLVAASLWSFDLVSLKQRLDGLVNLPKIAYLSVISDGYEFEAGTPVPQNAIASRYPLTHYDPETGKNESIGEIYVESNAQEVYDYLLRQFVYTLLLNMFRTLVVCTIVLMVFHRSINRRVFAIAKYLRSYNPRHPAESLVLDRNYWIAEKEDELDWLGDETNKITANVSTLYQTIRQEQLRLNDFALVSSDWLWETDANGCLIYCSETMKAALSIDEESKPRLRDIAALQQCYQLNQHLQRRSDFSKCEEQITINFITSYVMFQAKAHFKEDEFLGFRGTAINITELKQAQIELEQLNQNLERTVAERTVDLQQSMAQLQSAQQQLVEQEKLAALGGLVAGVAHEVNTPLGIAVTATSVIREATQELNFAFSNQTLTSHQFASLMERVSQGSEMLESNLNRAAKLIRDFKQTAVDQVSESRSDFNVMQVLDALIASLHPETRKVPVSPQLRGDHTIQMSSLPGVLTQVVSNLILNSVNHAFSEHTNPTIVITLSESDESVLIEYTDNGCGVDPSLHQKIFEPFFTSKRGKGGSGLGLNLVFNLVTRKLKGQLAFESKSNEGVYYRISLPKLLPNGAVPEHNHDFQI